MGILKIKFSDTRSVKGLEPGEVPGSVTTSKFSWRRIALAILLLIGVFGGAVAAKRLDMPSLESACSDGFKVLLGGFIGLIIGEAASK